MLHLTSLRILKLDEVGNKICTGHQQWNIFFQIIQRGLYTTSHSGLRPLLWPVLVYLRIGAAIRQYSLTAWINTLQLLSWIYFCTRTLVIQLSLICQTKGLIWQVLYLLQASNFKLILLMFIIEWHGIWINFK